MARPSRATSLCEPRPTEWTSVPHCTGNNLPLRHTSLKPSGYSRASGRGVREAWADDKGDQHGRQGRQEGQEKEPAAARREAETQGTAEAGQGGVQDGCHHLSGVDIDEVLRGASTIEANRSLKATR